MDSWKLNSYKEEHLEREDLGKILTQLNPPILCHPFLHPFSLMSWEIFVWTHKKKINSRHLTHSISTKDSLGPDEPSMA